MWEVFSNGSSSGSHKKKLYRKLEREKKHHDNKFGLLKRVIKLSLKINNAFPHVVYSGVEKSIGC